ncbi:LacI family transcriptional regulator [Clostridium saccharoperbutylacetonicum]|uniref:Transcriptional regulator, LacI family n=1 Tax=Clostridium saccharoperbutylacetonicum N1-4(HMT) TaxID=931276 RepID=M1MNB4_9CLOT|nr:LacI family DNA-binding transcriptional regulator [Clostridium saccharoperbutylacetonicum]AGF59369.1 transcriptional regulator, LacI family [Clostridium saccharoperbutylacetonicum N1-4(HMT)]NRT59840.1 LacI family transcriptional regulator [Clostridium saccharoperbutylacetonicum]NSB23152.1 LacI family transcriptional regulator [Clostridium saccharoperbutylacetonicum]NSB42523.1 LacI family transcriptional regulator [Clostridium saccharoperbutylacetonicum]
MSTIKDVAKLAGVSISTVSYALNNTGNISKETKKKILSAAKELEYTPNGNARSLKMKKNNLIAVVLYSFDGNVNAEIIRGIRDIARNNAYEVIIVESCNEKSVVTKVLSQRLVDGAIILSANVDDEIVLSLSGKNFPIVTLDRKLSGDYISSVLIDNVKAVHQAIEYMYGKGYRKIGIISGPKDTYDSIKRLEGFRKAIKEFQIENRSCWNASGAFNESSGYEAMCKLIKEKDLPEAYFCSNDDMAIGALRACEEHGIKVPEGLGIIGFDDIRLCEFVSPKLTTLRRPSYESGVISANNLINSLKGEKVSKCVVLTSELLVRESC